MYSPHTLGFTQERILASVKYVTSITSIFAMFLWMQNEKNYICSRNHSILLKQQHHIRPSVHLEIMPLSALLIIAYMETYNMNLVTFNSLTVEYTVILVVLFNITDNTPKHLLSMLDLLRNTQITLLFYLDRFGSNLGLSITYSNLKIYLSQYTFPEYLDSPSPT